jgi:hypothetical protein
VAVASRTISTHDPEAWSDALHGVRHAFSHTVHHARAVEQMTGQPVALWVADVDGGRVVCPVVERVIGDRRHAVTPPGVSGFATSDHELDPFGPWDVFAVERGWVTSYVGHHAVVIGGPVARVAPAYNASYVVDLDMPLEEIEGRLHANRRREVRGYDAFRRRVVEDRDAVQAFLVAELPALVARAGGGVVPWTADALATLCHAPSALPVGASGDDGLVAAQVLVATPDVADVLLICSRPEGRSLTTLLTWHGLLALHGSGVPWLNLGGGSQPDDAVARAKQRFGAQPRALRASRCVHDPAAYAALCARAGVDGDDRDGWFPPYARALSGDPVAGG